MHLWQWDIRTGAPLGLAEAPLQRYPLAVEGDSLYLGGDATALDVGELFNGIAAGTIDALAAFCDFFHAHGRGIGRSVHIISLSGPRSGPGCEDTRAPGRDAKRNTQ